MDGDTLDLNNTYEVVVSYQERTFQVINVEAETEEEVREHIREQFAEASEDGSLSNLQIKSVTMLDTTKKRTIH